MRKLHDLTIKEYVKAVASNEPTPGGGSVLANVTACAASLIEMVIGILLKRRLDRAEKEKLRSIQRTVVAYRKKAIRIVHADAVLYEKVAKAYALPVSSKGRKKTIDKRLQKSFASIIEVFDIAATLSASAKKLHAYKKSAIYNDIEVALELIRSVKKASILTADINRRFVSDNKMVQAMDATIQKRKRNP